MQTDVTEDSVTVLEPTRKTNGSPRFWMVWSKEGTTPPTVRYPSRPAARNAKRRLATRFPTQKFYVLKSESRAYLRDGQLIDEPWGMTPWSPQLTKSEHKVAAIAIMHMLESPNMPEDLREPCGRLMRKLEQLGAVAIIQGEAVVPVTEEAVPA